MKDVYSIASIGLVDGQKRLETISQNAASASLPGFKRQVTATRSFAADLAMPELAASAPEAAPKPRVDMRPGQRMATGRSLDVAIDSEDLFFAVTDGVQTWLTRAGAFRIDADGLLVGERGLRVQGVNGDIRLQGEDVQIKPDGQIVRGEEVVGALQLFKPNDRASLAPAGGTLLTASAGVQPAAVGTVRVSANALEGSNAGAATEMVDLLTLTRQFESLIRVTQGYDELLGRTIQKLGEV
jgi:flagellar basal body rod protein FlgG